MPEGNYIIIKGDAADANATLLRAGYEEVIGEAVEAGDITIVGETYTDNWAPDIAQTTTEQFLTAANNDVQAVLSENDGMAGGVVAALEAQASPVRFRSPARTATSPPSTGSPSARRRSSVWKDARARHGRGEAASQLCENPDVTAVEGTAPFSSPGGNELTSILLTPQPITQDNLDVVVDAGSRPGDTVPGRRDRNGRRVRRCRRTAAPPQTLPPTHRAPRQCSADTASMDTAPATTGG